MRAKTILRSILCLAVLALAGGRASAADILIVSDPWCPYACDPAGGQEGYMVEIARAAFGDAGLSVEYRVVNFQVMKRMMQEGSATAVPGASTDMEGALILPALPQGRSANGVAQRRGHGFAFAGPESFAGQKLAVVREYNYGGALQEYVKAHQDDPARIEVLGGFGYSQVPQGLRLVRGGGADLFMDDVNVLLWNIGRLRLAGEVEVVSLRDDQNLYLGFSRKAPKAAEHVRLFEQGLARLRADGRLTRILANYGLTDWDGTAGSPSQ